MVRIDMVAGDRATVGTRIAYWFTARLLTRLTGGTPPGMLVPLKLYAQLPRLLRASGRLEQSTNALRGISSRHRALAELKAATMTSCEYCIDLGSQIARRWGLSDAELLALPSYASSTLFTSIDKLVLDYAAGMSGTPVDVDDELVARLTEHFSPEQLVELTHVICTGEPPRPIQPHPRRRRRRVQRGPGVCDSRRWPRSAVLQKRRRPVWPTGLTGFARRGRIRGTGVVGRVRCE